MRNKLLYGVSIAAAGAMISCFSPGQAHAVPTLDCSASTIALGDTGGTVLGPNLLIPGTCVSVGDKIFGNFLTNGPGTASVTFTPASHFGNVTIGAAGSIGSSVTRTFSYGVIVDPTAVALGWMIDDITKDFSLNQAVSTGPTATATLSGTSPDAGFNISCTRSDPTSVTDSCPVHTVFSPVTGMTVNQTIVTGANTVVTVLTDTVSQINTRVPEPASLLLLGTSLLGLGAIARRRR